MVVYSVLYVDDEPDVLDITRQFLEDDGLFRVETSGSAKKMLESGRIGEFDAVITDYQMPGMNGIEFLKEIRKSYRDIPVLLYTGRGREEVVIEAINNGADFYVQKGGDPDAQYTELGHKLLQAIRKYRAERTLENFRKVFSTMPVGVLLLNENLIIQQASRTLAAMVLREPSSVIGERAGAGLGCVHSREVPKGCGFSDSCPDCPLQNGVRSVIESGTSLHAKIISLTLSIGDTLSVRWLRISAEPVQVDDGWYVIVAIDDVTDLITDQPEVLLSGERFGTLLNTAECGILLHDMPGDSGSPGTILGVNDTVCSTLKYSRNELVGRNLSDIFPEYRNPFAASPGTGQNARDPARFRAGIVLKDGTIFNADVFSLVLSRAGNTIVLSVVRDACADLPGKDQPAHGSCVFPGSQSDQMPV